jgi:hypothetical protein
MTMSPRMLAAVLLCWSGAAMAEDLVVIDASKAPALALGAVIPDGKAIELPAGAKVLLVGASGKTVSLTGPYSGTPSAGTPKGDGKLMVALASLVKPKSEETGYVGATRDLPWRTTEADILALDGRMKDTQCVVEGDGKQVNLLLDPNKPRADKITLMSVESGAAAELNWPVKTSSMRWPSAVPFDDGNTYIVDIPQPASQPASLTQFTVKVVPKAAANKVERISQLIEAGCTEQARMMVELIKKTAQ